MRGLLFVYLLAIVADGECSCGYQSCHETKDGILNVHLVPHSHDDVGWLKTVNQYFFGSRTDLQRAGVQYILDTVIDELMKDPNRRFIYVETAFFAHWWAKQDDQRRHHVKRLVSEGRLEFVGGAWSMHDEATVHYQSVIDQMTWGLRMLNDTFGECGRPRAAWQIDPFGHSRECANLFALAGYDGLLFGRADYQDKARRLETKEAEMIWRGSDDIGEKSDLFTGLLFNHYSPPPGFCFDVLCDDDPFVDDPSSPDYNVDILVNKFIEYANKQAGAFRTNHIIMTMGEDFHYQSALMWYKNLDKLIKYVNARNAQINVMYSTPSCYINALHNANVTWPVKQDDFLPYASDEHAYWTGFYTSRPTIKYFERRGNNFLQACKQLYTMAHLAEKDKIDLNMLRNAMGVMQHHDAVTGTEKQHVAKDYARILDIGIQDCLITSGEAINKMMMGEKLLKSKGQRSSDLYYLPVHLCQLNNTECEITETEDKFVITVYNPLGHILNDFIRIPVTASNYLIRDPSGSEVKFQINEIPPNMLRQMTFRKSNATSELIFAVEYLPPLGYRSYYIEKVTGVKNRKNVSKPKVTREIKTRIFDSNPNKIYRYNVKNHNTRFNLFADDDHSIGNENLELTINPQTGLVSSITIMNDRKSTTFPLTQELFYYEGMAREKENAKYNRPSGAYIFRPKDSDAIPIKRNVEFKIIKGPLVEEIHQKFSDWASQIIKIYRGQKHIEFEWLIGPIPIDDGIGKEVIARFTSNFDNNEEFFTDSNGRQMIKRIVNMRPTWKLNVTESVAGNYYPVTSMISIKDKDSNDELYVLTDRAQGGSSLNKGEVELMVHRRLLYDDAFGVGEALNETENGIGLVAKGTHYLLIGDKNGALGSRKLALEKLLQPIVFVTPANNLTFTQWSGNKNEFSGIRAEVPENVHILTLEPWKDGSILLRLEHILQKTDDPADLSKSVLVNLNILFSGMKITSISETTLAANQWLKDSKRLSWQKSSNIMNSFNANYNKHKHTETEKQSINAPKESQSYADDDLLITLNPMEIRTFIIKAKFKRT